MKECKINGIQLSGGQKSRIDLARAIYNDSQYYFFDDIFVSYDNKVRMLIFNRLFLEKLKNKLENQEYYIEFDETIKTIIEEKCIDFNNGARPIRRAVQTYIEDKIAEAILNNVISKNQNILMFVKDKMVGFKKIKVTV